MTTYQLGKDYGTTHPYESGRMGWSPPVREPADRSNEFIERRRIAEWFQQRMRYYMERDGVTEAQAGAMATEEYEQEEHSR